ncbi:S41 family peptidase [Bdellovibrio sp. NC01]|uniref:S41 family peptidase n=1 Tax=Bdellovibrio sp. NC01 TaxID=2220073 RepID=UPI001157FEC1|nr:S41 family peptidase [Bdellovibrio sp. NC01]QDK37119.1 carboxy-terminal processing protease [Bdellovibrio sp. NC01]
MQKLSAILFTLVCAAGAFYFAIQKSFVNPYPIVCRFVAEKIYLTDDKIKDWKQTCLHRARLVTPFSAKNLIIKDLNNMFDVLQVSHLEIYDAKEVQNIWQGESTDTGIEGDFVDSEFVIFKIHPQSPAAKAGLKKGDVVKSLNGGQPSSWTVAGESGHYKILRGTEELLVDVQPGSFHRDDSPSIEQIKEVTLMRIPSFRGDFFETEAMQKYAQKLKGSRDVILDLRGNAGGNFVAGLRLLSLFICEPTTVGKLVKTRAPMSTKADLPNLLKDEDQLQVLEHNKVVALKTFKNSDCFKGRVKVLVDGKSSSVAEMVAQAFKEIKHSSLQGAPSRGQLLVGVWYPLDEIAPGVQISVPEAYYESAAGHRIEGQGVQVDKILYYHLPQMQAGIDSWVDQLLRN